MKRLSFLFKDVKEYNKYLLSILSIFIILLTGIISYNYTNSSYAKWSSGSASNNVLKVSIKNKTPALKFALSKVGTDGLEIVTHTIDDTLQVDSNFATEYKYRGGDSIVKNYVTFNNETWKIIGILPTEDTDGNVEYRFKIIRDTSIQNYNWNSYGSTNNWTEAILNTYLNGDYYNSLSTNAQAMIGTAKYYLGGYSSVDITSDVIWQYERKNSGSTYYYGSNPVVQSDASKKIAIMYASDYGYGASTSCTAKLYNYSNSTDCKTTNNWLDKSRDEWLILHVSTTSLGVYKLRDSGYVGATDTINQDMGTIPYRPVLYLSSSVKITGESGTSFAPYTLSM